MLKGVFPIDKWDFKSGSVLNDLPEEELEMLFAHTTEHLYSKGQVIFREGAYPTGIFFIKEGKVKKYKVDKEGREQIVYVANTGELIGFHALLAEERYPDSSAVLENSKIVFIPKDNFMDVLNTSKVLARRLLKTLSHEFAVFANSLALFAQRSVRERFAMQLVLLREKYKQNFVPGMDVEINMSREDLASLVGTVRENILRILKDFKEEGILETKGRKIIIKDIKKLLSIVNQ
ncbi:Crp/Fnr family transcriptional regulator [Chitinophagaceae bacterium LB-8]|uniref:Crp/Fnr family transcriptional regulator n=1 Tax=Paraflavisolibacter caeni TaxID=2982496 RepID=A0A9X3BK66_9BACT|nr:Crp/Fnr family transcriptional regulator [Paraflavisolibacter caeni]MCU7552293.1 Crp/Fnr family transcriptional regulator [Paraflavisolibacter caeni]